MFSDKTFPVVNVPSYSEAKKTSVDNCCQTMKVDGTDKNEQSSYSISTEVQTDSPKQLTETCNVDEEALSKFLKTVCPKVIEELDKASKSKAFLSYQLPDEDSLQEVKIVYNLNKPKSKVNDEMKVNSLVWTCTGSVIVLGLGSPNHDDWCSHTGYIHLYNINTTSVSMFPTKILEANSCVSAIATHPYEPSILASGLFNGNVILWNLQHDGNECIAILKAHDDRLSKLAWISITSGRPHLISSGYDCKMNVWNASQVYDSLNLKESYSLMSANESAEAGVTCFSFSFTRPNVFVAALEGGKIVHCCFDISDYSNKSAANNSSSKNPIVGELGGHKGLVTYLAFSPYHADLFLSVGTDREIHVRSLFEVAPLKVIWCETEVLGIAWNPSQANIFISWGNFSEINIYDSKTGCKLSSLQTNDDLSWCVATFCTKRPKLLALGNGNGKGCVLKIPQYFKTNP